MYAVIGATGNTGRVVAENLLAAGLPVRVIGRTEDRLATFVEQGAEAAVGDVSDAEFIARVCDGVGGVYHLIPPRYDMDLRAWQTEAGEALLAGIRDAGVPYVVNLSSVGAQHHEGTGPIAGLREQEDRFNELTETNVLHLRPAFFMENFYMMLDAIRGMGVLGMPIPGDIPLAMIATQDIGAEAARRLAALDFDGHHIKELLGPRDYTLNEVASIIGAAIGKPDLPFVTVPEEAAAGGFEQMGVHPATVATFMEMYRGFGDGRVVPLESRSAANTTPTTLEEFAVGLAAAYGA
ncbi:MAG: NmrA family NAD(P)-binding protein [Gemmatimonadetes bacterium]|nr:NmrA family NAD(P)-binding protein [Gemmatimonadota bacterium]